MNCSRPRLNNNKEVSKEVPILKKNLKHFYIQFPALFLSPWHLCCVYPCRPPTSVRWTEPIPAAEHLSVVQDSFNGWEFLRQRQHMFCIIPRMRTLPVWSPQNRSAPTDVPTDAPRPPRGCNIIGLWPKEQRIWLPVGGRRAGILQMELPGRCGNYKS